MSADPYFFVLWVTGGKRTDVFFLENRADAFLQKQSDLYAGASLQDDTVERLERNVRLFGLKVGHRRGGRFSPGHI